MNFIDLTHIFEDRMPGLKLKNENGSDTVYTAKIYPFLTHKEIKPRLPYKCLNSTISFVN